MSVCLLYCIVLQISGLRDAQRSICFSWNPRVRSDEIRITHLEMQSNERVTHAAVANTVHGTALADFVKHLSHGANVCK